MTRYVKTPISSGFTQGILNQELAEIETAITDTLSRRGDQPNQMETDLDMNSNDIINVNNIDTQSLAINGQQVVANETFVTPLPDPTSQNGKWIRSNGVSANWQNLDIDIATGNTAAVIRVNTVADMKALTGLVNGAVIHRRGYNSATDGAADTLDYLSTPPGTEDNGTWFNQTTGGGQFVSRTQVDVVDVRKYGVTGSGDESSKVQAALDTGKTVKIPEGVTVYAKNLTPVDGQRIIIDGTVIMPASSSDGDCIFTGSLYSTGVKIYGTGTIDGNKANQTGAIQQRLVDFTTSSNCWIGGRLLFKKNYCPTSNGAGIDGYAVRIEGGTNNHIAGCRLEDWGREGFFLEECSESSITRCTCYDNDGDSWSGVQVSGATSTKNQISSIFVYNAGASGVGLDSTYSTVSDIIVDTVRFQNGLNLGHASKPASYSTVTNVVVKNLTDNVNANSAGLSIVNGTTNVQVTNFICDGSTQRGINISSSGQNVQLKNVRLKDCATALSMFEAGRVDIDGLILEGTITTGILKDQGAANYTVLKLKNADLTAATTEISGDAAGRASLYLQQIDVLYDNTAATDGTQNIAGLGAGGTVTVTNANVRQNSRIILEPSNVAGMNALPFISTQNDGSFVITTVNSGAGGAFVRWRIV